MNRLLLLISSILISSLQLIGQENENYIESELNKLNRLIEKGNFTNGFIFFTNDTLETELLTFSGKRKMNYHLFCVARFSNDSIRVFKPSEILGYEIENVGFITHNSNGEKMFIKQLKKGRVDLYERRSIPSDTRSLYYLKFSGKSDYFIINPLENNVSLHTQSDSQQSESSGVTVFFFQSKGIHQKFKIFISMNMGDCTKVTNTVDSEFYTINDILSIVETYNNCFE
jgi:hypothetical protein